MREIHFSQKRKNVENDFLSIVTTKEKFPICKFVSATCNLKHTL